MPETTGQETVSSTARKLTLGSALRLSAQLAAVLSAFLLTPFIVHRLGDRLYGIWSIVGTMVSYTALMELGMTSAMTRFLSRAIGAGRRDECEVVFNLGLRIYGLIGGVVLVLGALAAALTPMLLPHSPDRWLFGQLILIFTIGTVAFFATRVFTGALSAELRYDHVAAADLSATLLRSGATICALLLGYSVVGLAWASVLGWTVYLALSIWFTRRDLPFLRFRLHMPAGRTLRSLFSYSSYAFVSQLADLLRYQTDAFVTASFVGVAAVTHYRVAGMMSLYAIQCLNPALAIFQPVFSRQEARQDQNAIQKTFLFASKIALSVACFAAFGMIALGKPFIERWIGRTYLDAYPCLVILAIACALTVSAYPGINLLFGVSRHKVYAVLTITEGVLNLALSIFLARRYGMLGVALGTAIPMFLIRTLIQPVYVCHVAGIPYRRYCACMARFLASIALSLVLPAFLAVRFAAPDYVQLGLMALLAGLSYAGSQWFLLLDSSERALVLGAIRLGAKFRAASAS